MGLKRDGDLLRLDGAVTMETVAALLTEARTACRDGIARVDFSGVSEVDSAAIAFALELKRDALAGQRTLTFENLPNALQKLIELYGIEGHLGA